MLLLHADMQPLERRKLIGCGGLSQDGDQIDVAADRVKIAVSQRPEQVEADQVVTQNLNTALKNRLQDGVDADKVDYKKLRRTLADGGSVII